MRPSVILFYIGLKHIFATWERKYAMFVMTYRFSMSHFNGSFCQFTFLYHHIFTWYEKWHFRFLKTWLIEHHHHIHAIFTKNCWAKYKDQRAAAVGMKGYRCVLKNLFQIWGIFLSRYHGDGSKLLCFRSCGSTTVVEVKKSSIAQKA